MQFTTTDSHLSAHTSQTAYIKDSFSVSSPSVMRYVLIRWTHSKCFGEILQHILYDDKLMTSVLYSF